MTKAIKIGDETYERLNKLAGNLQAEKGTKVSIDEAILHLMGSRKKLSDFAGQWALSEKETKEMMKDLKKGWKRWTARYA